MFELLFLFIAGTYIGVLLGVFVFENVDGTIRLRRRAPQARRISHMSASGTRSQTSRPLAVVSAGSAAPTRRAQVYRLENPDSAGTACRFCGLDLAEFDHTDCRRGSHGNE